MMLLPVLTVDTGCLVEDIGSASGAARGVTVSTSAFPSLPPTLLCRFESRLGLESWGFSMGHFVKLVARVSPLLHRLMIQPIKIKLK